MYAIRPNPRWRKLKIRNAHPVSDQPDGPAAAPWHPRDASGAQSLVDSLVSLAEVFESESGVNTPVSLARVQAFHLRYGFMMSHPSRVTTPEPHLRKVNRETGAVTLFSFASGPLEVEGNRIVIKNRVFAPGCETHEVLADLANTTRLVRLLIRAKRATSPSQIASRAEAALRAYPGVPLPEESQAEPVKRGGAAKASVERLIGSLLRRRLLAVERDLVGSGKPLIILRDPAHLAVWVLADEALGSFALRFCEADGCERPVPPGKKSDSKYCGDLCRWRMAQGAAQKRKAARAESSGRRLRDSKAKPGKSRVRR